MFKNVFCCFAVVVIICLTGHAAYSKTFDTKNPVVKLTISIPVEGKVTEKNIYIELFKKEAPITVTNFLNYVNSGYYNGTIFHRVIDGFMIQGGGFSPGMKPRKTQAPIKNEAANGLSNTRGTLAMARTQIVDSATSQFFINVADNTFLDHQDKTSRGFGYAVFGKVIEGMEVVTIIKKVKTGIFQNYRDVPKMDVHIVRAERVKNEDSI